jgi:outer membrane murein-binding lipoprotein Lpp
MKNINKIFAAILVAFLLVAGTTYASFPVKNETKKEQTSKTVSKTELKAAKAELNQIVASQKVENINPTEVTELDEKIILLLLWFFLGGLAAHRWYKGKPVGWNILFIITAGGCGIWAIVDLVNILTDKF